MNDIEKSAVEKSYDLLHEIECSEMQVLKAIEDLQGAIKEGLIKADPRWVSIGKTNLELGYMSLLRAFGMSKL
jgi:hypothetical protein